jgi:hypothetical protein
METDRSREQETSDGDSMAEDTAYEEAFDMVGVPGQESAVIAHILSEMEDDAEPAPEPDPVLERERVLAVQKSQDSARPKLSPFSSANGH